MEVLAIASTDLGIAEHHKPDPGVIGAVPILARDADERCPGLAIKLPPASLTQHVVVQLNPSFPESLGVVPPSPSEEHDRRAHDADEAGDPQAGQGYLTRRDEHSSDDGGPVVVRGRRPRHIDEIRPARPGCWPETRSRRGVGDPDEEHRVGRQERRSKRSGPTSAARSTDTRGFGTPTVASSRCGPGAPVSSHFWWLIFVFGGTLGGALKAISAANERRIERHQERYRLKQQTKIAVAQARTQDQADERTHRREIDKAIDQHDQTDANWFAYEINPVTLLDFPMMTDMREPLTVEFHKARRRADLLRPADTETLVGDRRAQSKRPTPRGLRRRARRRRWLPGRRRPTTGRPSRRHGRMAPSSRIASSGW